MNTVDSNLSATAGEQYRTMRAQLWAAVDDEISMNDCDIYRYVQCFCRFTAHTGKMSIECGGQASQSVFYLQKCPVNFYEIL